MANESKILDQAELTIDLLVSQLLSLKATVTKLRKKLAEVSTSAPVQGNMQVLSDHKIAALLTKRQQVRQRRSK